MEKPKNIKKTIDDYQLQSSNNGLIRFQVVVDVIFVVVVVVVSAVVIVVVVVVIVVVVTGAVFTMVYCHNA